MADGQYRALGPRFGPLLVRVDRIGHPRCPSFDCYSEHARCCASAAGTIVRMILESRRSLRFALGLVPTIGLSLGLFMGVAQANNGSSAKSRAAACKDKEVGASCTFRVEDEQKRGTCRLNKKRVKMCVPPKKGTGSKGRRGRDNKRRD